MKRNFAFWALIVVVLLVVYNKSSSNSGGSATAGLAYSEFLTQVDAGKVKEVIIRGRSITGILTGGQKFTTYSPGSLTLIDRLHEKNVKIVAESQEQGIFTQVLVSLLPFVLLIGVWIFFMRQMNGGGGAGKAMGFGKSKAKLLTEKSGLVTFDDVAGIDEAKEELEEIVEFLREPEKFERLGGTIPKGALLVGPPGTGKTLLARAIAGEANVPFFTISGSDFVEMFVGVGASRVRDMFEQGKQNAPCIIFIDEIDAVGRHRGAGIGGGNDEREQTLNQLLVEMDGFEASEGVILLAATNRPDVLDPALLRPGRFDRQVEVGNPDIIGRDKILNVHINKKKVPVASDVKTKVLARGTPGFSGADLANLVNEAALLAARKGKRVVSMAEFEDAKDKVMMGAERRSMVMTEQEKKLTAYHESGHALLAVNMPASDPIHKATIIPRGRALGMVMQLPEKDEYSSSREKMHSRLAVLMAGRLAEEIIFGYDQVTSGASSDIKAATNLARNMVKKWGMSDAVGPLDMGTEVDAYGRQASLSERMQNLVDDEVKRFVQEADERARAVLNDKIDDLHKIAKAMLEYETLTGEDINDLIAGKDINKVNLDDKDDYVPPTGAVPISEEETSSKEQKKEKPSEPEKPSE